MKTKTLLLLITLLASTTTACKKKSESAENFHAETLTNSSWNGNLKQKSNNNIDVYDVNITFGTNGTGSYTYRKTNLKERETASFEYKADNKSLFIDHGYNNILAGYWLIESAGKNKLHIVRNIENPDNTDQLELTKIL
ncbi:hypothetical protein H9X96_06205 [Pedobacter sp. N36a]|uniref:hypothetical protein n=1 Tax=Pedobacter sp. N36a TaxID=2767996 RepID=UPI001656FAF3|nr:hypothetical protein [Pedobacter sp. N36a]MBC8985362.1 hypothetical protein [Pedobacter sp. N36a]